MAAGVATPGCAAAWCFALPSAAAAHDPVPWEPPRGRGLAAAAAALTRLHELRAPAEGSGPSRFVLVGPPKSGKSSLLFHLATRLAALGRRVLFVCPTAIDRALPLQSCAGPFAEAALRAVGMKYVESAAQLIELLASLHTHDDMPTAIFVDDLAALCKSTDEKDDLAVLCKCLAFLQEAADFASLSAGVRCIVACAFQAPWTGHAAAAHAAAARAAFGRWAFLPWFVSEDARGRRFLLDAPVECAAGAVPQLPSCARFGAPRGAAAGATSTFAVVPRRVFAFEIAAGAAGGKCVRLLDVEERPEA